MPAKRSQIQINFRHTCASRRGAFFLYLFFIIVVVVAIYDFSIVLILRIESTTSRGQSYLLAFSSRRFAKLLIAQKRRTLTNKKKTCISLTQPVNKLSAVEFLLVYL